ncbi:MAG: DUF4249 domain-containing protein [Bacteroidia bacterium]|nr:MAG: DUF4249 domain-containing protein [Bacteroidia bacterium]
MQLLQIHAFYRMQIIKAPAKKWAAILAGLFLFTACVELVTDIDFPDQEPKAVVHSFISPADTAAMVLLTWSKPISKPDNERIRFIENAAVQIRDEDGNASQLQYDPERKLYSVSANVFQIVAGQQYMLKVDVPGHAPIHANAYVPHANNSLTLEKLDTMPAGWSDRMVLEYSFTDKPGERENFYAPGAYRKVEVYDWENDTTILHQIMMYVIYGEKYLSNKGKEGNTFLMRAEAYIYNDPNGPDDEPDENNPISILLLTTDEHYYRYHRSLENYYPDDFFSEPVHIYSNVDGGLGVFAGYNRSVLVIE